MVELTQWIDVASKVLPAIAICVTGYFASRGLWTWRRQMVGQRRFTVAEEAITAFDRAVDAMRAIRSPAIFKNEGASRPRLEDEDAKYTRVRDDFFAPIERAGAREDDFKRLPHLEALCRLHFGPEAAEPFDALRRHFREVMTSARFLIDIVGEVLPSDPNYQKARDVVWGMPDDTIDAALSAALKRLTERLAPALK